MGMTTSVEPRQNDRRRVVGQRSALGGSASSTHTVVRSPIGPVTLAASNGRLTGLWMAEHLNGPARVAFGPRVSAGFGEATEQLQQYFAADRTEFTLRTWAAGTEFQRRVWAAVATVPFGQTRTYSQVADAMGRPDRWRAVAAAIGRNPIAVVVPCHRVIGANGSLTGYAGGLERKRFLLELESLAVVRPGCLF
jgi:methylated-DNA-[protein]-cysteine S-methyltransferase